MGRRQTRERGPTTAQTFYLETFCKERGKPSQNRMAWAEVVNTGHLRQLDFAGQREGNSLEEELQEGAVAPYSL